MKKINATSTERILNLIGDQIGLFLAFLFVFKLNYHSGFFPAKLDLSRNLFEFLKPLLFSLTVWPIFFSLTGLYRRWLSLSRAFHIFSLFKTLFIGGFCLLFMAFGNTIFTSVFTKSELAIESEWIRLIGLYFGSVFFILSFIRISIQFLMRSMLKKGIGSDPMLVIGTDENARSIIDRLEGYPQLGHKIIGLISRDAYKSQTEIHNLRVLGTIENLSDQIKKHGVKSILISHDSASHDDIFNILQQVSSLPIQIFVIPDLYDVITGHFKASFVHGFNYKELLPHHLPKWQVHLKRFFDIFISILMLILSSPILLISIIAIKLDSKGPILYSQERIGQYGKAFRVWKFRSMITDAEANGPQWAGKNDSRITKVGAFLRKSRIDEIPQFLCVLAGDMSIVGPRPEREFFIEKLKEEVPLYGRRLLMKPGITGWAQVRHHYDTSIEDVKQKIMYDLYYFENMSLGLDVQIMLRTVWVVFTGSGAH